MKSILNELNRAIAARGSLVITKDGIQIASSARAEFRMDVVAALVNNVIREAKKACDLQGSGDFDRFVLNADYGRMIVVELPIAYLVVITSIGTDIDHVLLEVDTAAKRVARAGRIAV